MARSQINIRLNTTTGRQIAELAARTGMSKTTLISTAVDRYYREENRKMVSYAFNERTQNWQDVMGDGMTAAQVVRAAATASTVGIEAYYIDTTAYWLERHYNELAAQNPQGYSADYEGFYSMARQVHHEVYEAAERRVNDTPELAPHAAMILEQEGEGVEHWLWIVETPVDEILSWVHSVSD